MKKLLLTSLILGAVGSSYAQTVKKVIIEDFTGRWCQFCPDGTVVLEDLHDANPTNLIPVASHNDNNAGTVGGTSDPLEIAEGAAIPAFVGIGGFPSGAIDRKMFSGETTVGVSRSKWGTYFSQQSALTAPVSISFGNARQTNDTTFEVDLNVKFTAAPGATTPMSVQVYVLEDKIPAENVSGVNLTQINNAGGPHGGVSPLTTSAHGYYHNSTLRKALGGTWGWTNIIPATGPVVGTTYTKHVTFTIPGPGVATKPVGGWKKAEMSVVAFVAYNGSTKSDKEILNGEQLSLKSFFPVGVNEVKNVSILGAYPNPALSTDVIKVEYNIEESAKVSMKVYNSVGQLVAQPFSSDEVKGAHTLQWKPADNGISAGLYMIEVSTDKGTSTVHRVTIQ